MKRHPPLAGDFVDGLEVWENVDNTSSIGASFTDYEVLPGIREVPMKLFTPPRTLSEARYDLAGQRHVARLIDAIEESGAISPLIVAVDAEGPYILEGGHRFDALGIMRAKAFPAVVVLDLDDDGAFEVWR